MNSNKKTLTLLLVSSLCGIIFFCVYQEWLVIYWSKPYKMTNNDLATKKKTVLLWKKKNNTWVKESAQLLWSEDQKETMKKLTNEWLAWLEEERDGDTKVSAESVLLSPSGYEVYISFDRNPFTPDWSIHQKESFIKALLRTYKENDCTPSCAYFLVNHAPLKDPHLDFEEPWNSTEEH